MPVMSDTKIAPSDPRFSVIIPVFNGERFIREALDSLLNQSYAPVEIIVVDDGSTDNTAQIVRQFASRCPLSYHRQANQGPSAARNRGVALAHGDWIAFLDADDVWYPAKLATHCDYIREYPDVVFFWSDMSYIDEHGRPRKPKQWRDPFAQIIFNRPVCPLPSSVVMRKDIFAQALGFNTLLRCYEDLEFFFRVVTTFPSKILPRELLAYRCHDQQTHSSMRCVIESWPMVNESLSKACRADPAKEAALNRRSASLYSAVGGHFLRSGNFEQARHWFRRSFDRRPFYWKNLRRWGLSYFPGARNIYRRAKRHAIRV